MYSNAMSRVRIYNSLISDSFEVQAGVHQGSVLSPLLFIIVLEALSRDFRTRCPWELLLILFSSQTRWMVYGKNLVLGELEWNQVSLLIFAKDKDHDFLGKPGHTERL